MLSCFSHVQLFAILWTVASQAPLSMGFSRKEYCSRLPCPRVSSCPRVGHDWATELTDWLKSYFYWCQDYQNSKWNLSHSLRFHLSKKQFKDIFKKCTYAIHIHTPQQISNDQICCMFIWNIFSGYNQGTGENFFLFYIT